MIAYLPSCSESKYRIYVYTHVGAPFTPLIYPATGKYTSLASD